VTSAAGCSKTDGRDDSEGRRRAVATRKEDICGAAGICRFYLSARACESGGECKSGMFGYSGNRAFRQSAKLYRLTAEAFRLAQRRKFECSSRWGITALRTLVLFCNLSSIMGRRPSAGATAMPRLDGSSRTTTNASYLALYQVHVFLVRYGAVNPIWLRLCLASYPAFPPQSRMASSTWCRWCSRSLGFQRRNTQLIRIDERHKACD